MLEDLILTVLMTSVPLVYAAIGELIVERSGVLNLGVEGMMLMGAVAAFGVAMVSGSLVLGVFAGAIAGMLTASLIDSLPQISLPVLSDLPFAGKLVFSHDLMAYGAVVVVALVAWFLKRTRGGLVLRAIGDNHDSAHALGYPVLGVRFVAVLFGGMMAGLGGAYLPLMLTPHWAEGMTAGRGWIALALVVFASWMPWRVLVGALIFGGITIMQLAGQAEGWTVPSQFLSMLPYLATIIVLVLISRNRDFALANSPACLGRAFHAGK